MSKEPPHGTATHLGQEPEHQTSGMAYIMTGVVLLALTGLTLGMSFLDTGVLKIPIALAIAVVKGSLVVVFFMHLNEQRSVNRVFMATALAFIVIMLFLFATDVGMRNQANLPADAVINDQNVEMVKEPGALPNVNGAQPR